MKITKKVMIIIFTITLSTIVLSTIVLSIYASKSIVKNLCAGEVKRSFGRTVGVLGNFDSAMDKLIESCDTLSEWFELAANEEESFNIDETDSEGKVKLNDKIADNNYSNLYLLDKNFELKNVLKEDYSYSTDGELNRIINIISNENLDDSTDFKFSGVVSTPEYQYMVYMKSILKDRDDFRYLLFIEPFSGDIYKESESFSGLVFVKKLREEDLASFEKINFNTRDIYIKYSDELVTSYTKIDSYGNGGDVYISLAEKPQVIESVKLNLNRFISIIAVIFIAANAIIYFLIKGVFVNRMLNINNCVNKIINTFNLKTRIPDDEGNDEISVLTHDLNSMFILLEQYSNKMKYISGHDIVTKLLNRRSIENIGQGLIDNNEQFSLAFIDLDNFKKINDSYGHNVGDDVLCKIADHLLSYNDKNISCGRLGGDEFIILLKGDDNNEKIIYIIKDIFDRLKEEIYFKGVNYSIRASVGICYFPEHGDSMAEILQNADIAMYSVKKNGGNNYCIFQGKLLDSLKIESKIAEGLRNGQFEAYFQPIGNLKNGKISGAEALIRWNTENGIMPPDKFIPIAKKSGYIIEIDKLVIEQSCKVIRELLDKGLDDFQISINASFKLLSQKNFLSDLMETIRKHDIGVKNIKLEITEDETIEDSEYMVDLLKRIRECGIQVSLDDFGTGYSSFNYIKTLPLDVLKIDKSLLYDLEGDKRTENIIKTIINLAHILKLTVTCEGVETREQLNLLEKLDCDNIQGYYLSRPLQVDRFREFIEEYIENLEDKKFV